jgi:type II secretory pathway component GspD/PulD (secretin)
MEMAKRTLLWGLLLAVFLAFPTEGKTLFLQTATPAQGTGAAEGLAAKALPSASFPMQTYKLKYVNAKNLADTIDNLLGQGEGVAVDEKLNAIILRASDKTIGRLSAIIEKMDVPPLQVQVEAKIIELKTGSGDTSTPSALGVGWKYTRNAKNYIQLLTDTSTTAASSLGLYAQLLSGNTEVFLSALEKSVGYNLVASPWITALNHEQAEILIGSKYGYKTLLTTLTSTMQEIQFLEVGTRLKFTPHINDDGFIIMEIYPSVSEGSVQHDLPQENTTETKNKVLVKDGQSIVVGGLTKQYNDEVEIGIPVLSALPLIGNLFRRTELKSEKRELMVLITPHIVTPQFLEEMSQKAKELDQRRQKWGEKAKLIH